MSVLLLESSWEVMGSIPVGDSDFFSVPRSCHLSYKPTFTICHVLWPGLRFLAVFWQFFRYCGSKGLPLCLRLHDLSQNLNTHLLACLSTFPSSYLPSPIIRPKHATHRKVIIISRHPTFNGQIARRIDYL